MQVTSSITGIQGWGADLDHKNRPAYPKERIPARDIGVHWTKVTQQPIRVKVFHSNERPEITPVFGSTLPPTGLSGMFRSWAFKHSENDIRHWLILMAADRINVVEGIFDDLRKGHIPNIFAEMGGRSALRYNKKAVFRKILIATAITGVAVYLLTKDRG